MVKASEIMQSKKVLPVVSLLLFGVSLLVILTLVHLGLAAIILAGGVAFYTIIKDWKEEWVRQFFETWEHISYLVHWSIIFIVVLGTFYFLAFFIRNYQIKIVPRNEN